MPVITIDLKADEMGAALLLSVMALAWSEQSVPSVREVIGFSPEDVILDGLCYEDMMRLAAFGHERFWEDVPFKNLDPHIDMLEGLTVPGRCYYVGSLMKHHLENFRYIEPGPEFLSNLLHALGEFDEAHAEWMSAEQIEAVGLFLQFCLTFDENDPQLVAVSLKWADYVERFAGSGRALAA